MKAKYGGEVDGNHYFMVFIEGPETGFDPFYYVDPRGRINEFSVVESTDNMRLINELFS